MIIGGEAEDFQDGTIRKQSSQERRGQTLFHQNILATFKVQTKGKFRRLNFIVNRRPVSNKLIKKNDQEVFPTNKYNDTVINLKKKFLFKYLRLVKFFLFFRLFIYIKLFLINMSFCFIFYNSRVSKSRSQTVQCENFIHRKTYNKRMNVFLKKTRLGRINIRLRRKGCR